MQNGKFSAAAWLLVSTLKKVDLPTFGIPTIPTLRFVPTRPINGFFSGSSTFFGGILQMKYPRLSVVYIKFHIWFILFITHLFVCLAISHLGTVSRVTDRYRISRCTSALVYRSFYYYYGQSSCTSANSSLRALLWGGERLLRYWRIEKIVRTSKQFGVRIHFTFAASFSVYHTTERTFTNHFFFLLRVDN